MRDLATKSSCLRAFNISFIFQTNWETSVVITDHAWSFLVLTLACVHDFPTTKRKEKVVQCQCLLPNQLCNSHLTIQAYLTLPLCKTGKYKRIVQRWLIGLWGGVWERCWEENPDRWKRVDFFPAVVLYEGGCIVSFVKFLYTARTDGITHIHRISHTHLN